MRAVVGIAALAVLLGAADLALLLGRDRPAPPGQRSAAVPTLPRTPPTTHPPPASTGTSASTTSTSLFTSPPGAPQLTSITPPEGGPGTVVTVAGNNLWSPSNGVVLARVDGQPTHTDCPSRTTCQITVPSLPAKASTVSVTVTTDAGTSNPLSFGYT